MTNQAATPGFAATRRSRPIGFAAVILAALALAAGVAPAVEIVHTISRPKVVLAAGPRHVSLPPHVRYGVFFNDLDNSGYSEACSGTDAGTAAGKPVFFSHNPGFFMTSSDTDNLDLVFDTGSGNLVLDCQSTAEQVSVRPVPDFTTILIGAGLVALFGAAAAIMTILWFARIGARPVPRQADAAR